MNSYCTIITSDYFFYAKAIFDSLETFDKELNFHVLVVDEVSEDLYYKSIQVHLLSDLTSNCTSDYDLIKHYEVDQASKLRWALKPLFLKYLLLHKHYKKSLFLDPDLFFYNDPSFLFEELETKDVIITPHWRSKDPIVDPLNFDSLFTGGLYNAGFFGCNSNAVNILNWWLQACAYKMEKKDGFYVDQIYLNLMPIYFSNQVKTIEHKGCNVSNWNMIECLRSVVNNEVIINEKDPIIFIHFTNGTINGISFGNDHLLEPLLHTYRQTLLSHKKDFKFKFELDKEKGSSKTTLKQKLKNILGN